jgi:hypothetical protein
MSSSHNSRLAGLAVALMLSLGSAPSLAESTLTYGGDAQNNSYASWTNILLYPGWVNQIVFDNFSVPPDTQWDITAVFANGKVFVDPPISALNWEIRQGMVTGGSTGSTVASGSGTYSYVIAEGFNDRFTVATPGLVLGSGEYWLGIWADLSTAVNFNVGIGQTGGANSVNALGDGRGIWLVGADAANQGGNSSNIAVDLSYGLVGNVVPEPGSALMFTLGLCGLVAARHLRRGSQ